MLRNRITQTAFLTCLLRKSRHHAFTYQTVKYYGVYLLIRWFDKKGPETYFSLSTTFLSLILSSHLFLSPCNESVMLENGMLALYLVLLPQSQSMTLANCGQFRQDISKQSTWQYIQNHLLWPYQCLHYPHKQACSLYSLAFLKTLLELLTFSIKLNQAVL